MTANAAPLPRISVVVPVRNDEEGIAACLESLLAMTHPPGLVEIIAVDNGSSDRTRDVIRGYPVIAATEPTPGSSAARNAGIALAQGEIIAFTDADCVVARDWADEIDETFRDPTVDAVLGFAAGINVNLHAALVQKRWEESWFEETAEGRVARRKGVDTRNCAIRRRVLESLQCFDPDMKYCADLELSVRLIEQGCNVVFNPRIEVSHRNPASFSIAREKSRQQLPYALRLRGRTPSGVQPEDVPVPSSAFHGIGERQLEGAALVAVLALLLLLRAGVRAAVSLGLALRLQQRWVFKLYKVFFGISYDAAILRARHQGSGG